MALTTDRISVLRGRPPVRAGGRRASGQPIAGLSDHWGMASGSYPFYVRHPLLEQTLRISSDPFGSPWAHPALRPPFPSPGRRRWRRYVVQRRDDNVLARRPALWLVACAAGLGFASTACIVALALRVVLGAGGPSTKLRQVSEAL